MPTMSGVMNNQTVPSDNRIGIIDLGSNSARLVIYEVYANGGYRPCYRMKRNTRLARFLQPDHSLSEEGVTQAVADVSAFVRVGSLYNVTRWIAVATAAIRQAANGADVLARIEEATGVHFRLITGREEAYYSYLGIMNTMEISDAVLVDVGGASTEVMLVRDRSLVEAISVPYGALTLTRAFANGPNEHQAALIMTFMSDIFESIEFLPRGVGLPVIGTGGTARSLGKIAQRMQRRGIDRYHGYQIDSTILTRVYERVSQGSAAERGRFADLSESRAEVIHAGAAAVLALVQCVRAPYFLVSGNGLREGVFYEHWFRSQANPVVPSVRSHSTENFMRLFGIHVEAAERVAACVEYLFGKLEPLHHLPARWSQFAAVAARVEQAGTLVNVEKSGRHTDYLVRSSYLYGFTQEELLDIGQIALGKGDKVYRQLSLLVTLSRTLVYETSVTVGDIEVNVKPKKVVLQLPQWAPIEIGLESVQKAFLKLFGAKLSISQNNPMK